METINTANGHLDQEMKNLQLNQLTAKQQSDSFPTPDKPNVKKSIHLPLSVNRQLSLTSPAGFLTNLPKVTTT